MAEVPSPSMAWSDILSEQPMSSTRPSRISLLLPAGSVSTKACSCTAGSKPPRKARPFSAIPFESPIPSRMNTRPPARSSRHPTAWFMASGWIAANWCIQFCTCRPGKSRDSRLTAAYPFRDCPGRPVPWGVLPNPDGSFEVLLQVSDGTPYKPADFGGRAPEYRPYDGAGIWRGGHPYVAMYAVTLPSLSEGPASEARLVSTREHEVRSSYRQIAAVDLGVGHHRDIITGSHYGGLHHYPNTAKKSGLTLEPRRHVVDIDGIAHRHPTVGAAPMAYPNPQTGRSDLIAGGEGGLYFYRFLDSFTAEGEKPVYEPPTPVLEQPADLYACTLAVPTIVDWDGDGALDIVTGNSEGQVLVFRNAGTNAEPAFLPGEPIEAGGRPIHVQPGYRLDIQGPGEARWGYTCPTVIDWNGDGLPDIVMSDSTARHTVFLNTGTPVAPRLAAGHPIYYDGLDLYGTWRVKPAAARLNGRMAYAALDDEDEFRLYWQIDAYNLEDGGKLRLTDGSPIKANFLHAGGTGRLKLNLVDWDLDGKTDLLVGTPRHGSVPNPETGLPQSLGLPGSSVLFLRNVGSDAEPVFEFPRLMHFRGKPIFLGQHACGPAVADFGLSDGPDLVVGTEDGRFHYYKRDDLSWPDEVNMEGHVKRL